MLGRRSLSSDKKRGFRVEDGGLGAEERGWGSPCGGRFLPNHCSLRAPGVLTSQCWAGAAPAGAAACRSAAHTPHQTPLAALCSGAFITAPSASDHAWPCLPLDLEEAAATSVFPLGLLAPAACRVPGGLIKFDLFFSPRQSISPPPPPARRPLFCPLRPWGVSDCLSACAQLRAKPGTQGGGVVP